MEPADHPSSRPSGATRATRPFRFSWEASGAWQSFFFPSLLAYLWFLSSQVGEGPGKDGLIQAGTLSQAVLLGDSVEGSEVEPICERLHARLCEVRIAPSLLPRWKKTLCGFVPVRSVFQARDILQLFSYLNCWIELDRPGKVCVTNQSVKARQQWSLLAGEAAGQKAKSHSSALC